MELRVLRISITDGQPELPSYATAGASGLDLNAASEVEIPLLGRALVRVGIAIEIPDGFEGQIRSRSGLASAHGVVCMNSPGTVDSDFRGEICVLLANLGDSAYVVRRGDRIAQLVIAPVQRVTVVEATQLSDTPRGGGGFGSSGS